MENKILSQIGEVIMIIKNGVRRAKFVKRPNRFQGYVILDGEEILVHVPNTGRCKEILIPNTTVILRNETNPNRKTKYSLIAAYKDEKIINIDSQAPNNMVEEALNNKVIEELKDYHILKRESTFGNSRFDFKLQHDNNNTEYYLEIKGVTLEENDIAYFPDAPTERGIKHILELIELKKMGTGAGILFVIQLDGVKEFRPSDITHKAFGDALRLAHSEGVEIMAYISDVTEETITICKSVPIKL